MIGVMFAIVLFFISFFLFIKGVLVSAAGCMIAALLWYGLGALYYRTSHK